MLSNISCMDVVASGAAKGQEGAAKWYVALCQVAASNWMLKVSQIHSVCFFASMQRSNKHDKYVG